MIVFPAIDLKGGDVVRLAEGDMDRATVYGDDPAAQARLFADAGAEHLHEGGDRHLRRGGHDAGRRHPGCQPPRASLPYGIGARCLPAALS